MSTCDVQTSAAIELYFYDELAPGERASIERHVRTCEECRRALDELSVIRVALAARPDVSAPPRRDWSGFMARLESAVSRERLTIESRSSFGHSPTRPAIHAYLAMAALLAVVIAGVAYVARSRGSVPVLQTASTGSPVPVNSTAPPTHRTFDRSSDAAAFLSLSEQHFERSKLVVLGLTTKNPQDVSAEDWEHERQLASTLLNDTRLYRVAAEGRGMSAVAGVMRDLELVLLQTSLSKDPDAETLERLQRLIRKRDLVTKMEVVNTTGL